MSAFTHVLVDSLYDTGIKPWTKSGELTCPELLDAESVSSNLTTPLNIPLSV